MRHFASSTTRLLRSTLCPHRGPCDAMQLTVDERYQPFERMLVTSPPCHQQPGNFACSAISDAACITRCFASRRPRELQQVPWLRFASPSPQKLLHRFASRPP
jgi:hypothetical protein